MQDLSVSSQQYTALVIRDMAKQLISKTERQEEANVLAHALALLAEQLSDELGVIDMQLFQDAA